MPIGDYSKIQALITKLNYNHLVKGAVVADGGEGLRVELELTADELLAILHQRAAKIYHLGRSGN